jgi:hypothetical protein
MKKTLEEFKKMLPPEFLYISGFDNGMQSKVKIKNKLTGKIHNIKAENYIYLNPKSNRVSEKMIIEECEKRNYKFIKRKKTKIVIEFENKNYEIYLNNFMNGMEPKEISVKKTSLKKIENSRKNFIKKSERDDIEDYKILEFSGMKKPMNVKHLPTNTIHKIKNPQIFSKGGYRDFPWDLEKKQKKIQEEFLEKFDTLKDSKDYEIINRDKLFYKNNKTSIRIKHIECGNIFLANPGNFLNLNNRCPYCALKNKSGQEIEVLEFIKEIYSGTIEHNYKLNNEIELDIYLPDLKLAIEYNGLYWHSEKNGRDKTYHLNKTNKCKENNIRLIHIFEDEWVNKNDIVKSKLTHILELNKNSKIYARKCNIKQISTKDKNKFLNENHIQGEDKSGVRLGLYYNNLLVSVMTFSRPRSGIGKNTKKENMYELVRFASDKNKIVIGAFSKLLKHFLRNYEFDRIITYADLRWSIESNIYEKTGFVLKRQTEPNYWYADRNYRYHRYGFRKQLLKEKFPELYDSSLTEFEIMDQTNYNRIWDCGNLVYELKKEGK